MKALLASIDRFICDENGATAIEYGLIAGLIAVTCIVGFSVLGVSTGNLFGATQSSAGTLIGAAADSID